MKCNKTNLKNFVITEPMRLVHALRCIIDHLIEELIKKDVCTSLSELIRIGKLNKEAFQKLYQSHKNRELTEEDLKFFLTELGLAFSFSCSLDNTELFVPSMISDRNEDFMREKLESMKKDPLCLSIVYLLPKTSKDCHIFEDVLAKIISRNSSMYFGKAFSQKIEKRKSIGEVAAIFGITDWKAEEYEFCLADVETNPVRPFYSTHKVR